MADNSSTDESVSVCFAGFALNRQRAELRGPDGKVLKLRPKTFALLDFFVTDMGRVLSKQELMEAVWPNVYVGDDSLFQCIKEIRAALGDDKRQMVKLVSGRGYLFEADVLVCDAAIAAPAAFSIDVSPDEKGMAAPLIVPSTPQWHRFDPRGPLAAAFVALIVVVGLAIAMASSGLIPNFGRSPPTIAVMPIAAAGVDAAAMAAIVTRRLADGLAKIETIRVLAPQPATASAAPQADFLLNGELHQSQGAWDMRMRLTRVATGEVVWAAPTSITISDSELSLQQSRLTAGVGHSLALRLSALLDTSSRSATSGRSSPGSTDVVIEQATASIMQTNRDRFATAEAILEKALAGDPDNVDLAVSLAAMQMRGIQMVWYSPADGALAERRARAVLERALQIKPNSIPVLEAYCRFLNVSNDFAESLVGCARVLNFDPWNGLALYHIGLAQLQLGRFEDAITTFQRADSYDTPPVSRWTWRLGLGMTYVLLERYEQSLPWLLSSIDITPASGRSYMLLAAAYHGLGRQAEAKAAMEKALALRPGSNKNNVLLPTKNPSPAFTAASKQILATFIAAGLPEH